MPQPLRHVRGKQPDEVGLTTKIKAVIHTFLDMLIPKLLRAVTVNRLTEDIEPFAGREASLHPKEAKFPNELAHCRGRLNHGECRHKCRQANDL